MRARGRTFAITVALFAASGGTAHAQTAVTAAAAQSGSSTAPQSVGTTMSHWAASAFIGSSFETRSSLITDRTSQSVDYGGQIAYLWKGVVGPEFIVNVAPNVRLHNFELADDPDVRSYMFNVMGAIPLGATGRFQPYLSGGWGSFNLHTDLFAARVNPLDDTIDPAATVSTHRSRSGNDIGAGITAIAGHIGFRGDVRYFRSPKDTTLSSDSPEEVFTEGLLSGLHFWRGNVGLAFIW